MLKSKDVTKDVMANWTYDYNGKYVCFLKVRVVSVSH